MPESDNEESSYSVYRRIALEKYNKGKRGGSFGKIKKPRPGKVQLKSTFPLLPDGGDPVKNPENTGWWGDLNEGQRNVNDAGIEKVRAVLSGVAQKRG